MENTNKNQWFERYRDWLETNYPEIYFGSHEDCNAEGCPKCGDSGLVMYYSGRGDDVPVPDDLLRALHDGFNAHESIESKMEGLESAICEGRYEMEQAERTRAYWADRGVFGYDGLD